MSNFYSSFTENDIKSQIEKIKEEINEEENKEEIDNQKITELYNALIMKGLYLQLF